VTSLFFPAMLFSGLPLLAMPPRPPNFLPANRRRRLDPSRRLRSRELWNRVRYLSSSSSSNKNNNNIGAYTKALLHAIAYECQPFPIVPTLHYVLSFVRGSSSSDDNNDDDSSTETTGLARFLHTIHVHITSIILLATKSSQTLNVATITSFIIANKITLFKSCLTLISLLLYRRALIYLHDLLAIGPLVIIVTLLTVLYTVGLGDNTGANSGIPSAYSVFNKGMARLLGTIDGEELARQYAGGGGAGAAAAADTRGDGFARLYNNNNDPLDDEEDEVWEEWIDEEEIVNERRRQRRLERLRRREHDDDDANNNHNVDEDNEDELDDTRENDQRQESALAAAAVATRKKSGKKARRKDLELRREMQQQRRVAAAMGFGFGDELAVEDIREIEARFALLE